MLQTAGFTQLAVSSARIGENGWKILSSYAVRTFPYSILFPCLCVKQQQLCEKSPSAAHILSCDLYLEEEDYGRKT